MTTDSRIATRALARIGRSIRGRLIASAALFLGLGVILTSLATGELLDRSTRKEIEERIDTEIALVARGVRQDGSIDRVTLTGIAPLTLHGWRWEVAAPKGTAVSDQYGDRESTEGTPEHEAREGTLEELGEQVAEGRGASRQDESRLTRSLVFQTSAGPAKVTVHAPRHFAERVRRVALFPWTISFALLMLFLATATLLQIRIGLKPLARLKSALQEVREGRAERVPEDQPEELRVVVAELNHLLAENTAALARARGHLANLAHGLKTPLATLRLELGDGQADEDRGLSLYLDQMERTIRHHLARARAASPGSPGTLSIMLASVVDDLVTAMSRIHAERGLHSDIAIAPELMVRCDRQDLEEMLGNLFDNAWRWAATRVAVSAAMHEGMVEIRIDDDGPGLSPEAIDRALLRGQRLDERGDGYGFGLPIARELAELHGGSLELTASPPGGLRVSLRLPV